MTSRKLAAILVSTAITLAAADGLMRVDAIPESKIVQRAAPVYPPDALDAHIQGTVRVAVVIGTDGHVEQARLMKGHPLLAPAAVQAAKKYVFHPFERDGKPVRAAGHLDITFSSPDSQ